MAPSTGSASFEPGDLQQVPNPLYQQLEAQRLAADQEILKLRASQNETALQIRGLQQLDHSIRQFFRDVRAEYDFVVIDAPPVLPVADAVVVAGQADATLVVTRAGRTPREALTTAVDALDRTKLLGVVLSALPDSLLVHRRYYSY
jgi:Mrp family chromosome partitioning ATPase